MIRLLINLFVLLNIFIKENQCVQVTLSNVVPRVDTNGNILDAHDGNIVYYDGLYYFFGPSYGLCREPAGPSGCASIQPGSCGFQTNHNVSLYTSPDLSRWTPHGPVFEMSSLKNQGIMFCPKVLYNSKTNKWVLWFNYLPISGGGFSESYYAVATANTAQGSFQLINDNIKTLAWDNTGDFSLFQDDNGDAYIIYTSHIQGYNPSHLMSVE